MRKFYFPEEIDNFLVSLGHSRDDVLADLFLICLEGPELMDGCTRHRDGIWEYKLSIGFGRYAVVLFMHEPESDAYIGLHGFRGGRAGASRADIKFARDKRKPSS